MAAPSVPTGLRAYPGDGQVTLYWDAAADLDNDLLYYFIYRAGGTFTIGQTSNSGSSSTSSANKTVVSQFTGTGNGTLFAGHARLWIDSGTAPNVQMVVYADSAGVPGALLATSDAITISNTSEALLDFVFSGAQQIAMTRLTLYWIGFTWPDPGIPIISWSRAATASAASQNSANLANPFGAATTLSGPIDAYVEIASPVSGVDTYFGLMTEAGTTTIVDVNVVNGTPYVYRVLSYDTLGAFGAKSLPAGATPGPAGVPFLEGEL